MKAFRVVKRKTVRQAVQQSPPAAQSPAPVPVQPAKPEGKILGCDLHMSMAREGAKSFDTVKQGEDVVDYRNVTIRGYLSTWQATTPSDRDGDYVVRGAFTETLPRFLQNPVLLVNHRNTVDSIAGRFTVVREDDKGLYVEALLTNSPSEWAKDVRWKVANDELKTLSMGGYFQRGEDGRAIEKVSLYEGSLTPVPANPDAVFSVRELDSEETKKAKSELDKSKK